MTLKQLANSRMAPDGSQYSCITTGNGVLTAVTTSASIGTKAYQSSYAADGSRFVTLTNGNGTLL